MGNANLRAVAESLYAAEQLLAFHTSIATYPGNLWDRLAGLPGLGDFRRRHFAGPLRKVTHQYPWKELGRMLAGRGNLSRLTAHETGAFSVDSVYHALDEKVARRLEDHPGIRAVYAYEDGALATFERAKELGLKCIYDLPIAYWETRQRLLGEEAERWPVWAQTLGGAIKDSPEKLARKTRELELADVVVGPGSFVMDSLPDWAADKMRIESPFGSPAGGLRSSLPRPEAAGRPLRVLFVGSMGQRKGLADLFAALRLVGSRNVELVVLGSELAPTTFYRDQLADFRYEPTRSHAGVLELMASCDVFCLPSLVEGRALVMQEAMSQGLPVIITPNTGGADLVVPGETGFLVPIRSPEAIAEAIDWFASHRGELPRMARAARQHAATYTWRAYGDRVSAGVAAYLGAK